jgi:hypothetical protein
MRVEVWVTLKWPLCRVDPDGLHPPTKRIFGWLSFHWSWTMWSHLVTLLVAWAVGHVVMAGFHLVTGQFQLLADVILDVIRGSLLGGNAQNSSLQGRWTCSLEHKVSWGQAYCVVGGCPVNEEEGQLCVWLTSSQVMYHQNGLHRKRHFQQFLYCCITCILSRKLFIELLSRSGQFFSHRVIVSIEMAVAF